MDVGSPDLQAAVQLPDRSSEVEPCLTCLSQNVELDESRKAKRDRLFQIVERTATGTVEKVLQMQRIMRALVNEQIEHNRMKATVESGEPVFAIRYPAPKDFEEASQDKNRGGFATLGDGGESSSDSSPTL